MPDFLHVVPIRDDTVRDGQSRQAQHSNDAQCVCIPPWAGGTAAIVVGACDLMRLPLGFPNEVATPRREQHT